MSAELPWHAAYPAPRGAAPSISREELLQWIREGKQAGKDFVLVDLRRTDYEVWSVWKKVISSCADMLKGRNDQRVFELASSEFIPHDPNIIFSCIEQQREICDLVLW